jgi:ADP-ribosylglycohydrolase
MQNNERLRHAYLSLSGLAVGDAYGNHHSTNQNKRVAQIWEYSDDTLMALSIVSNLRQFGTINQDVLAQSFAQRRDAQRGYGQGVTRLLKQIRAGANWREATYNIFDGSGSFGNGAAMRVAPLGAYFSDDLALVVEHAKLSAEVTHAHPEGIASAIAVALAASIASDLQNQSLAGGDFIGEIISQLPASEVRDGLVKAMALPEETTYKQASDALGNGRPSIAQRTVPFAIWAAAHNLYDYKSAIEKTASVGGDVDTNCSIVGGIVVMATDAEGIPSIWRERCEPLPQWAFEEIV